MASSRANVRAIAAPRIGSTSATKGVGRIYQQTFIDTYAKVAFTKLYDRKTPITAGIWSENEIEHGLRLSRRRGL